MLARADVIDCFSIAVAVFPQYPVTESQVIAYAQLLSDLDVSKAQLAKAISEVCKVSRFFPTIAEIREALRAQMVSNVPARQPFNALEFANPEAVSMPESVRAILAPIFEDSPKGLSHLGGDLKA